MQRLAMKVLVAVALLGSAPDAIGQVSEDPWRQRVVAEVQVVLDGYREAMLSRDYDAMLGFWSDSDDFVFAGDGRILGGFEAWRTETTKHYKATRHWEQWDWQSVHILPLAPSAASATLEARFRWVDTDGLTHNLRGAWTYVFVKSDDGWKVVHTNGTHVKL